MPTVHLDAVTPDAIVQSNAGGMRYVRCGWVDDIELDASPDPGALMKVLNIIPQRNAPLSNDYPWMILQDIQIIASVLTFRRVYLRLTYSTLPIIGTTYFIREDTQDGSERVSYVPGSSNALLEATKIAAGREVKNYFSFDLPISMRTITVTSMKYGAPYDTGGSKYLISPSDVFGGTQSPQNAHNYVNSETWPTSIFPSMPAGYWRINRHATDMGRYDGYYVSHLQAVTKTVKDWSFVDLLRDDTTGKPVEINPGDFATAMALPYSYGIIGASNGGFIRVGFFQTTDFYDIFGF